MSEFADARDRCGVSAGPDLPPPLLCGVRRPFYYRGKTRYDTQARRDYGWRYGLLRRWQKWRVLDSYAAARRAKKAARASGNLRARERVFVSGLAQLVIVHRPRDRAGFLQCAALAFGRSHGYPLSNKNGSPSGIVATKARKLVGLPKIQQALADAFETEGIGLSACAATLKDVMTTGDPETRLRAVELVLKSTTGFATQKTANLQLHGRADAFFESETFAKTGPPRTET